MDPKPNDGGVGEDEASSMTDSRINRTDCTLNPWEGCAKVSLGCINCYAEVRDRRNLYGQGTHRGVDAPRRIMSDAYWRQPLAWNREAKSADHFGPVAGEFVQRRAA